MMALNNTSSFDESWHAFMNTGEQVFLSLAGILMGIIGGLGNGVVVAFVSCSPAMRSAINLLLATLALTDIMLLLVILPLDIVTLICRGWILPIYMCYAHEFLLNVMHLQGMIILMVICIDRYVIIVYRQDQLTPRIARWIIAGSWLLSICLAMPPLLGLGSYVSPPLPPTLTHCLWKPSKDPSPTQLVYACVIFLFMYLLPLITIGTCFTSILVNVRRNAAKIHTKKDDVGGAYNGVVPSPQDKEEVKPANQRRPLVALDIRYKTRTFTTILMLFLVFVACRSPLHFLQLIKAFSKNVDMYHYSYIWLLWLAYLQPAVNPIIYTIRIKKFREELIEYFPCLLRLVPGPASDGYRRSDPGSIYMIHEPRNSISN